MDARGALVDGVPALDLVAEHVDVVVERLGRREGRLVGEAHGVVDDADDGLVHAIGLALLEDALLLEAPREDLDRVALAPLGDLLLRAVLLGVGHRVAAEAVGDRLDEHGLALLARLLERLADDGVGVEHVHAVALHPRHPEALPAAVEVGDRGVALERRAHPELVVGDHEDDGEVPQRGEIERLTERPLVGRAVAEDAERDVLRAAVVGGEGHARGEREVAADDAVATHEAVLEVEHVHGAAAPVRDALLAAEQLGHDAVRLGAARERVAMRAVGRDEVVLVAHRAHGADDGRLLADREVQEAADLGLRVHLTRSLLEAADEHHRLEPLAGGVALGQLALLRARVVAYLCHPGWTLARNRRTSCVPSSPDPAPPPTPPGPCWPGRRAGASGRRTSAAHGASARRRCASARSAPPACSARCPCPRASSPSGRVARGRGGWASSRWSTASSRARARAATWPSTSSPPRRSRRPWPPPTGP